MHILEIPSFFPPYGGHFCIDQSKALVAQGHVVRVIAALNVSAWLTPKLYLRASRRPYDVVMDGIEVTRCEMRSLPALNKLNARRWCRTVQRMADAYADRETWNRMSLYNIARSGIFAADRSIADYADTIWHVPYKK